MSHDLETLKAWILKRHPELAGSQFTLLSEGWQSVAVDVDDTLIFKFPRDQGGVAAIVKEAALLAVIRNQVAMPVPEITLLREPVFFSRHEKIRGSHLLREDYDKLAADAREELAQRLGLFYAQLHQFDRTTMQNAGAEPVEAWLEPAIIRQKALPLLRPEFRARADLVLSGYENLPEDPHGMTYGYFDGHGWNMAFDHAAGRLNGLYDFADSGIGALHQDFVYSSFISRDLTARIVRVYESLSGRSLDRRRIAILTATHRLWELAVEAENPATWRKMRDQAELWFEEDGTDVADSNLPGPH